MAQPIQIAYVTSSGFKRVENDILCANDRIDSDLVGDLIHFDFRTVSIKESLEVDITEMVKAEVAHAYRQLRVPCIVEHAGLIFEDYLGRGDYPGGLTKPMWDFLGEQFLEETHSAGRRAIARAVVAYCDGQTISTYVGETAGKLADEPRGNREFYWDTVFVADDAPGRKTYAEIADDPDLGLEHKVLELSQSTKAMRKFIEARITAGPPYLWPTSR